MSKGPKTLFGRFFLITILPILILQTVTAYIFYERHWQSVSKHMENYLIGDFKVLVFIAEHTPSNLLTISQLLGLPVKMHNNDGKLRDYLKTLENPLNAGLIEDNLSQEFDSNFKIVAKPNTTNSQSLLTFFWLKNNKVLEVEFSKKRFVSPTTMIFICWVIGSAALLILISLAFMRNQVKAIVNLAVAADKLGKNQEIGFFKPSGAREVRIAGKAFLHMKERIERQIKYRTEMLAHISHDLRTPLTRIRLQAALLKDHKLTEEMEKNISEMERLIQGYLNFAKEEGNETSVNFEVTEVIRKLAKSFSSKKISLNMPNYKIPANYKPEAFKRAVSNIIANAIKYSRSKTTISIRRKHHNLIMFIDDDGPGIPVDKYDFVFQPFSKINKNSEGFGLGLAIVKTIILSHGGKIRLAKSPLGGLRVIIKLPL